VKVGIIDSGIDLNNEDLADRVDTTLSTTFTDAHFYTDAEGHGSHVAGIVGAAGNNGKGITGVCWDVDLVALKITDHMDCRDFDAIIEAIEYSQEKGIHILNISINVNPT